jgi:hypothetical protein
MLIFPENFNVINLPLEDIDALEKIIVRGCSPVAAAGLAAPAAVGGRRGKLRRRWADVGEAGAAAPAAATPAAPEAKKKRVVSQATRDKISAKLKALNTNPERKAKISESMKAFHKKRKTEAAKAAKAGKGA